MITEVKKQYNPFTNTNKRKYAFKRTKIWDYYNHNMKLLQAQKHSFVEN